MDLHIGEVGPACATGILSVCPSDRQDWISRAVL